MGGGQLYSGTALTGTKNYVNGIEYNGANLEAIYHADGRLLPNGAAWHYDYTLKDHLGNARVTFRANGTAVTNLEDFHYYPFGMQMEGIGTTAASGSNKYRYNGKEMNDDLGLNLSDYGARWYDGALGRWWSVDPLGEKGVNVSPYTYVLDNPMGFIDPTGMEEKEPVWADGLTNSQWLESSRPGNQEMTDGYKKKNREEEIEGKRKRKMPTVYYTNAAKISTNNIVKIFLYVAEIYKKNGVTACSKLIV